MVSVGKVAVQSDAPALAASVIYGILLEPLSKSLGDFGSLVGGELAQIPLHNSNDSLAIEFARMFSAETNLHA